MSMLRAILAAFAVTIMATSLVGCAGGSNRESTGQYIDSAAITTKVKAKLAQDEQVSVFDISVETFKDVVQLSGFVDNAAQKQRAAQVAASVEGVRKVENNISVK